MVPQGTKQELCQAIEEIMDLMSKKILGAMADLSDRLFGIDAPKDLLVF